MKFAAQVEFTKIGDAISYRSGNMVSALYQIFVYMTSVEYDIFNPNILESPRVKFLPDGLYTAFMCGTLQEENNINDKEDFPVSYIFLVDDKDIDIYRIIGVNEMDNPEKDRVIQRLIESRKEEEDASV